MTALPPRASRLDAADVPVKLVGRAPPEHLWCSRGWAGSLEAEPKQSAGLA